MKNIILSLLLGAILVISCKKETKTEIVAEEMVDISAAFNQMLADYYENGLQLNPIMATFAGDDRYNHIFPNFLSKAYKDSTIAFYKKYKKRLHKFDDKDLSDVERMSKAILLWDCTINLEELKFRKELLPIDQMWSLNLQVGQLASGGSAQPFETVEDYENWLKRLEGYALWLQSAQDNMKIGAEIHYVLPNSLISKVIPQLKALTNKNLDEHLFYTPVKNFPKTFTEEEKKVLTASYTRMLEDVIIPAYDSLHDYMTSDYLKAGRSSTGIHALPGGKEYYNFAIKKYTTTDLTAEEIHEIGLKEVARILDEMEKVKSQVKFEGDIISFFDDIRSNKKLMPYKEPQEVIDNFYAIHEKMKPQLDKLFDIKPKTQFVVKRTEAFREASASAQYNPGSLDGTRPGIFYVPIPDAETYNVFSDEALFLHEAIPGHHYQGSLTQENENLPSFRKTLWYSAYGEGWALYTESLGKELGLYNDPYQYFGMLGMEMHRAIRLVVDTGMHAKGWTREQAIQYSLENEARSEASIISEIERYMANPGQALSYKIGQLKIRELRQKAENTLGEKFDIREFHNQVLETGCVPLALLEDKIDHWIAIQE